MKVNDAFRPPSSTLNTQGKGLKFEPKSMIFQFNWKLANKRMDMNLMANNRDSSGVKVLLPLLKQ